MWGGDIAIATGGWAASRAAAGRVRAGPDIRRGAAAALDGTARAAGGPVGTVPRPAPGPASFLPLPSPVHFAPGLGLGGARRATGRAQLRAPAGSEPVPPPLPEPQRSAPLSPPAPREVCGQRQDGPACLWLLRRETAGRGDGAAAAGGHRAPRPLELEHTPPSSGLGARPPCR